MKPVVPVGFDYVAAIREIRKAPYSDEKIAKFCGYLSGSSIAHIVKGVVPAHPQGEAIWALYRQLFNDRKPPHSNEQAEGDFGRV